MIQRLFWFCAGLLVGAAGLYGYLWQSGKVVPSFARVASVSAAGAPLPATLENMQREEPAGEMVSPIEGLKASELHDTFNAARPGERSHEALDIMEPRGTPVRAVVDGVIEKLFLSVPGGNTIYQFDQDKEFCYYYAHLDSYAKGIYEGQEVVRGTVIGYVGSTGNADPNAPHLHLGISWIGAEKHWWGGTPIDPYPILLRVLERSSGNGAPLDRSNQ